MLSNGSCALITTYEGSKLTSVTAISQVHISSAESCEQITRCTGSGRLSLHRCYDLRVVQAAVFVSLASRLLDAIAGRSSLIGGSTSCVDVLRSHAWTVPGLCEVISRSMVDIARQSTYSSKSSIMLRSITTYIAKQHALCLCDVPAKWPFVSHWCCLKLSCMFTSGGNASNGHLYAVAANFPSMVTRKYK